MVADARVGADAAAHVFDVGADALREAGELVHERDARRQHGVGGVLGELGRAHVHHASRARGCAGRARRARASAASRARRRRR